MSANIFTRFFLNLQFIFKPSYWLIQNDYSADWDRILNNLLDNHRFTEIDRFTAKLGNRTVWMANHPYASFTPYRSIQEILDGKPKLPEVRPSRLTIQRAYRQFTEDRLAHELDILLEASKSG